MTISRDDLLKNELKDEEYTPNKTISEAFEDDLTLDGVMLGAIRQQVDSIKSVIVDKIEEITEEAPQQEKASFNTPSFTPPKASFPKPDFDFKDINKKILMNNAWNWAEREMAVGSVSKDDVALGLGINAKTYDKMSHAEFIRVQSMEGPVQVIYTAESFAGVMGGHDPVSTQHEIQSKVIEAKTRKLQTSLTMELMQDARCKGYGGIDETELVDVISTEIACELDRELLQTFRDVATTGTAVSSEKDAPTGEEIIKQIHEAARMIDMENQRSAERWVIASPALAAALLCDREARQELDTSEAMYGGGLMNRIGSLHGMDVYTDNGLKSNEMFVGRKGTNIGDSPISFHPYNLVLGMGTVVDHTTFQPRVHLATRGTYNVNEKASKSVHHIEFKHQAKPQENMDAGFFYAPYIPLIETKVMGEEVIEDDGLEDIIIPFGPKEQATIAALFDHGEKE